MIRLIVDIQVTEKGLSVTDGLLSKGTVLEVEQKVAKVFEYAIQEAKEYLDETLSKSNVVKSVDKHKFHGNRIDTATFLEDGGHSAAQKALGEREEDGSD